MAEIGYREVTKMTRPRRPPKRNRLISQRLLKFSSDPYRRSQFLINIYDFRGVAPERGDAQAENRHMSPGCSRPHIFAVSATQICSTTFFVKGS